MSYRAFIPMELVVCTFNNRGFPRMTQKRVNLGDYAVRDHVKPDLLGEQERWFANQLGGYRKIFNLQTGYNTYSPESISGTICARRWGKFQHLAHFQWLLHERVPFVCNQRKFTGEVLRIPGTNKTLTYASAHFTPSAFSNRFKAGSRRRRNCQSAWREGMERLKTFAEHQIEGGRDWVIYTMDANAQKWRVEQAFGKEIAGKKVHVFTSPTGYKIDHIVVIGDIEFIDSDALRSGHCSDHDPFWVKIRLV